MPSYRCLNIHSSPRMMVLCIMIIVALLWSPKASAFLTTTNPRHPWIWNSSSSMPKSNIKLSALSERQIQFWEDVEDGLMDMEQQYKDKGMNMHRIHTFVQRAKGDIPLPIPLGPFHEPSEEHLDGLTARPLWDVVADEVRFPWARALEEKAYIIQEELEEKLMNPQNKSSSNILNPSSIFAGDSIWQNKIMGTGWSAIRLQRLGVWNVEQCQEFPKTMEVLQSLNIPFAVRGVCFARQAAGSGVQPHSDGRNFILTSHLGLKIPQGCWMKVGDEVTTWEDGKLITVDTSFQHSTGNPTDSDRYVLIIDFWHPETTDAERASLDFIYNLRNQYESGKIPFRKPNTTTRRNKKTRQEEKQGLQGLFDSLFAGPKS